MNKNDKFVFKAKKRQLNTPGLFQNRKMQIIVEPKKNLQNIVIFNIKNKFLMN